MGKKLIFKVGIKGLEDKIWRKIEICDDSTFADLVYAILATFELYSNEGFVIWCENRQYDSVNEIYDNELFKSAMSIKWKDCLSINKEIMVEYDFHNRTTFVVTFLEEIEDSASDDCYLKVVDGAGKGALDYVCDEELKQIVDETDNLGYSNYSITVITDDIEEEEIFDYREFDLKNNRFLTSVNFDMIKDAYESITTIDLLRIMKDRKCLYIKTDIWEVVKPFDYIKKYIPDNYDDLSYEEKRKLSIPDYKDLNIYMLPTYQEINHKEIMTLYVKKCVVDKKIRQALFYTLRNDDYLDKYYNQLRTYGLFQKYLEFSNSYYEKIFDQWKIQNNIKN